MNPSSKNSLLAFAILCICLCANTNAQVNNQVETITTEDGLSQGMIFDLLQDREGFIWIATKDGLNRYDGFQFKVFTNDPNDPWSISGNTIVKLFEDSAGRIWATADNTGINIYDKKTGRFHHIRHDPEDPSSLSGNYVSNIEEDTSGYFITAVNRHEINMFRLDDDFFISQEPPKIIRISMPPSISSKDIPNFTELRGIIKDRNDRIWVSGSDIIYQFQVQKAELIPAIEGYSFFSAYGAKDGSIWASSPKNRLFNWNGIQATTFISDISDVRDFAIDKNENLWALPIDSLFGYNLAGWSPDLSANTSNSDRCFFRWAPNKTGDKILFPYSTMLIDRSGSIWIGTNGLGIYKINPKRSLFSHELPGVSIRNIISNSEEKIFTQTYYRDWIKTDNNCNSHPEDQNSDCFVGDIIFSKSGVMWSRMRIVKINGKKILWDGTQDEPISLILRKYNPSKKQTQYFPISWHHDDLQPMIVTQDSSIWMAGYNNVLSHLDPETGNYFSYDLNSGERIDININEEIQASVELSTALYEDSEGVIWAGTLQGFSKCIKPSVGEINLKTKTYKNIPGDQNSLNYNHVSCFLEDPASPDRYLWVCTKGGGLNRLDKKTGLFIHLTQKDGLPDDVVYGILSDDNGNIWGSTNKGIFCMSQTKSAKTDSKIEYSFRNFSKSDGLQENEFNTGAYAKLADGRLAFGGVNGYNVFEPKEVLTEDFSPPIYIVNIMVNNKPILPEDGSEILENTIESTNKITLSHKDQILTLEFASLDYSASDRNKYRYQLVGANDTWIEAENRRSATFLNLQPNEYTFRVQGSNSQGIWSDHIAELHISILPPWWKTWWAYLLYTSLIAAAIATYYRFSIKRAKLQQQLTFEIKEAGRIKELDMLKTQLYMNMTHEFRTPLTIILGMAKQVQDNPKEHFSSGLNMIIRNGQNLLNLVNKMLNLSKLESGKMSLELVQGDVVHFLAVIVESFRSFAINKEIQLHFLPEIDSLVMDFDGEKLQQVVSNLISNAFKFTPEGGHIYFNLRQENESLVIRVKDTGNGISPQDLDKVFDRFYQVDNSITRQYDGSGIGLALSKELVNLMQGNIFVQSPPPGAKKGSEFRVDLPIGIQTGSINTIPDLTPPIYNIIISHQEKPIANGNLEKPLKVKTANTEDTSHINETHKPLILIAEDNEDVASYISSCLPEYRLSIAANGQEGFDIASEVIPDLIISDVMMPIMDGFEFCRKLKMDNRTDHIPVIMLTARADNDSKLEGLELGANAYLPKPFEKQELILTIKNLFDLRNKLRRHHQNIAGLVTKGELEEDSHTAKVDDAFVIKVREYIEGRIDDFDLNVEQLSNELHLSHSQFGRKLDALTGFSPNRFIRFIRLKKAQELLMDQNLSITVVAYDCGFNDPSYFTRVFKKEFGKTPLEWRMASAFPSRS